MAQMTFIEWLDVKLNLFILQDFYEDEGFIS